MSHNVINMFVIDSIKTKSQPQTVDCVVDVDVIEKLLVTDWIFSGCSPSWKI